MATEHTPSVTGGAPRRNKAALSDDYVAAFQGLVGEIFRLNGSLLARGDRLARDLGISPARWQVIATIRNEPLTIVEISRRLGLTRQSVQRTVNRLIDDGVARTKANPEHRRSHLISLTRRGRECMTELSNRQVRLTGEFTGDLGLEVGDLNRLARQLRRIREAADGLDT